MPNCKVPFCKNKGEGGKKLFEIPVRAEKAVHWINFLEKHGAKNITQNSRICQDHFHYNERGIRSDFPCYAVENVKVILSYILFVKLF